MPGIDDAWPPPPAAPPGPTQPWHRGRAPAGRHGTVAAHARFTGISLLSELQVESEGKRATSPSLSLSPSPAGPCTACRPPPGGVGISAQGAWRPAASQADVMANSRHLAHPWDF